MSLWQYKKKVSVELRTYYSVIWLIGYGDIKTMALHIIAGSMFNHTEHRICIKFSVSSKHEKYAFMMDFYILEAFWFKRGLNNQVTANRLTCCFILL